LRKGSTVRRVSAKPFGAPARKGSLRAGSALTDEMMNSLARRAVQHSVEHPLMSKLHNPGGSHARRSIRFNLGSKDPLRDAIDHQGDDDDDDEEVAGMTSCNTKAGGVMVAGGSDHAGPSSCSAGVRHQGSETQIGPDAASAAATPPSTAITKTPSSRLSTTEEEEDSRGTAEELFEAVRQGDSEALAELLKKTKKKNLAAKDEDGNSALILAAEGEVECVRLLLEAESPLNLENNNSNTALNVAVTYQDEAIVRMLLAADARVTLATVRLSEASSSEVRTALLESEGNSAFDSDARAEIRRMLGKTIQSAGAGGPSAAPAVADAPAAETESFTKRATGRRNSVGLGDGSGSRVREAGKKVVERMRRNSLSNWFSRKKEGRGDESNRPSISAGADSFKQGATASGGGGGMMSRMPRRMSTGGEDSAKMGDHASAMAMAAAVDATLDKKLEKLRDELLRDARQRDPLHSLERLEATIMAMATKLDGVMRRQIEGDRWM
jgi:hypothetical protein